MRADLFLKERGYAKSRSAAAEIIRTGVYINGVKIEKPSQNVPDLGEYDVKITNPQKFVSRGGLKLEAALDSFGVSPAGISVCDIGASTGGFTDCLLQRGASKVYAVDVGHGQLDSSLACDKRVVNMEGVNARDMNAQTIGERVALAVTDVSFISQALIYNAVSDILIDGGIFISLIKPQFEAGRENIGSGGIVRDEKAHISVIEKLIGAAKDHSLSIRAIIPSPIKGGDGNTEYLALFIKNGESVYPDVKSCVRKAFGGNR